MNSILIMVASAALAAVAIAYKIVHWKNYRHNNNSRQPFKLIFSSLDIAGAPSREKKDFMRDNNLITAGAVILLLLAILVLAWKEMLTL